MYWDYKKNWRLNAFEKKLALSLCTALCFFRIGFSQNVTSPYSILGIGDIDTKDYGRYFLSGNASLARRDLSSYNFSNPASLTSLPFKTLNFDIALRGKTSTFSLPGADTTTSPSKDMVVKRITMAFKLNNTTGIAFGLRPYSSVNYKFEKEQAILDGNSSYTKFIEGNGGINQVYFSVGKSLSKHFSAGLTTSWLFGSLQRTTQYTSSSIDINITKQETDFYNGAIFQGGMQYYSLPGKTWKHQIGITGSVYTNLFGELSTEYSESSASIKTITESGRRFKMPISAGIGYSAVRNDKLTLSVEANYYKWPYQKVDYTKSYSYPSMRFSTGLDYSFKSKQRVPAEKSFVGFGFNIENSYLRIKDANLWDYSFTLGGGLNLFRTISLYTGIEFGKRGDKSTGQIQENYTQYIFGITLKDIWISSKRFGRYD